MKKTTAKGTYHAQTFAAAVRGPAHGQAHPSHVQPAKRSPPPSAKPRGKVID